jgi:drug/metabolite transporter (DMT)-like permease
MIWGLFPVITVLSLAHVSPLLSAGISNIIAAVFFGVIMTIKRLWKELFIKEAWYDIIGATLTIGVIFYGLNFTALSYTSTGNQSILALTEISFSFLIMGVILKRETITKQKIIGSILMTSGALLILFQQITDLNIGDLFVLIAAAIGAYGNAFAKKALDHVSSITLMFFRSGVGGIIFITVALIMGDSFSGWQDSWIFLLINGLVLLGITKIMWLECIKRIDVSLAVNFFPLSTAMAVLFAYFLLDEIPNTAQLLGFIPIIVGLFVLTRSTSTKALNSSV